MCKTRGSSKKWHRKHKTRKLPQSYTRSETKLRTEGRPKGLTGLGWTGLDWIGLGWAGLDWTGLDCVTAQVCGVWSGV
eukprot:767621-Prorocentrum_minimum.AAC.1